MEELKRLWVDFSLTKFEVAIHNMLPWDVGDSRFSTVGQRCRFRYRRADRFSNFRLVFRLAR
jgi:hypothetical protein